MRGGGRWLAALLIAIPGFAPRGFAQRADSVVVVVNDNSPLSRNIGEYYVRRRGIPVRNLCRIKTAAAEEIKRPDFDLEIANPIGAFLKKNQLVESVLYIVTTAGVPLKIAGTKPSSASGIHGDTASVDSELTLLYSDLHTGQPHRLDGIVPNPFFTKSAPFSHPQFPVYLVTRLAGYDFNAVKELIDRSVQATDAAKRGTANHGKFVFDLRAGGDEKGDKWLRAAAKQLPKDRVVLEESAKVLYGETDVIGFASWGSNDPARHNRRVGFRWRPGAVMTEFVSTNARTFVKPPDQWELSDWNSPALWFAGSPQTMTADYIQEGVTGASGHTNEPYLSLTPRPDFLFPAYYSGRNLAESYYLAIAGLSWQNIVVGDPLCSIGKPH